MPEPDRSWDFDHPGSPTCTGTTGYIFRRCRCPRAGGGRQYAGTSASAAVAVDAMTAESLCARIVRSYSPGGATHASLPRHSEWSLGRRVRGRSSKQYLRSRISDLHGSTTQSISRFFIVAKVVLPLHGPLDGWCRDVTVWIRNVLAVDGRWTATLPDCRNDVSWQCIPGARFTKYLTTILRLSYDNAKVTIDLWRTTNLQNILQWMEAFS